MGPGIEPGNSWALIFLGLGFVSLLIGAGFYFAGATLILPFSLVEIAALVLAYIYNAIHANDYEKLTVEEHRIFQQFISKQNIGKINLSHRYRFEQRFVENDFKMRFRYLLGINIPLQNKEAPFGAALFLRFSLSFFQCEILLALRLGAKRRKQQKEMGLNIIMC